MTRAADYAVRALIHLALQPAGTRLSQVDLAAAIDAPAPFVGKVMQQLALAQLVTSQRGIGGGFALRLAAGDVTMLDAITAIEGPLTLNTCLSPDEPCRRSSFCPAHHVWREAQERVTAVLGAATIGALAAQVTQEHGGAEAAEGPRGVQRRGTRARNGQMPSITARPATDTRRPGTCPTVGTLRHRMGDR